MGDRYFVFDYGSDKSLKVKTQYPAEIGQEIQLEDGSVYKVSRKLTKVYVDRRYKTYDALETLYILTKVGEESQHEL
jgi:hypothetical protein